MILFTHRPKPLPAVVLAVAFAFGLGAIAGTVRARQVAPPTVPSALATTSERWQAPTPASPTTLPQTREALVSTSYPVEVIRVLDGDTFEARVRIWLDLDVTTKVRLRGIDAPERKARCAEEAAGAEAAARALETLLQEGGVVISDVRRDKYGGRVLATAATRRTADVGAALLAAGLGRPYAGARRAGWCGLASRG